MSAFDPTQHPRGNQSTGHGGQFAVKAQSGSEISLGTGGRGSIEGMLCHREAGRAETILFDPMIRENEADGYTIHSMTISHRHGDLNGAAGALVNFLKVDAGEEGQDRVTALLRGQTERKVTLLSHGESGALRVIEGRAMDIDGTDYVLLKGSRKQAYRVDSLNVIDAVDGYGHTTQFESSVHRAAAAIPSIERATVDDIPIDNGTAHDQVAAVFIYNAPNFTGDRSGRGSIIYATDITEDGDDPIINGAFVFPPESGLVSEHGSIRLSALQTTGGRVSSIQPTLFSEALQYGDDVNSGARNIAELYAEL
ncbi:hypothetical protein F8O07_07180 [Pseudoclavibacter sp. CFCC 13796]|uniref:hypothetical protein n=1 Tax=Pseudoclavibacter sp. CFCC 13796 TaxID=2615179 RepID=UPI00130138AE|nr:hypothetical protein [Pseudoclavibacter sp. CFCC 13796]KAB1661680.1 hypothetical protein F8O07_07180 [Pseudoclavibacter sp. CFCC 13796]